MISRTLPAGTTLRSLVEVLLPEDHAEHVPADAGEGKVCIRFVGGTTYLLEASGSRLNVEELERAGSAPLLLGVEESTAQLFLSDWLGPQKLAPSFAPRGIGAITDARLLRRVSAVKGVIALTLDDFEGQAATLVVASGPDASLYDDPDVTLRISMPAFLKVLAGTLPPDEAITGGHVTLKGKKLIAMQFALSLVPYFPDRAPGRQ